VPAASIFYKITGIIKANEINFLIEIIGFLLKLESDCESAGRVLGSRLAHLLNQWVTDFGLWPILIS
jgi:hypothetical protein